MKILGFDLSASYSSIAILSGDEINGFTQIHDIRERPAWEELFSGVGFETPSNFEDLDAIAFANGPGSYTALRNIATFLKPIAHIHNLPLVPVSSLKALALVAYDFMEDPLEKIHVAVDAQKETCYFASYVFKDGIPQNIIDDGVVDISELYKKISGGYCVGNAWKDYHHKITYLPEVFPHAGSVCRLASFMDLDGIQFLPVAANPIYLEPLNFKKINE